MRKILILLLILFGCLLLIQKGETNQMDAQSFHSFTVKDIDGSDVPLADYKGKAVLVVNTASKCGFTKQYKSLQTLYESYKARGLEILAFPANNFLGQEPGDNAQIKEFCSTKFNVTFPLFSKISVKGKDIHPLYTYLTNVPGFEGDISWNFNKFLIDGNGNIVARYGSRVDPLDDNVTAQLEQILPEQ